MKTPPGRPPAARLASRFCCTSCSTVAEKPRVDSAVARIATKTWMISQ